jgi:hypothetical protein
MLEDIERRHLTPKQTLRALRPTEGGLAKLHDVAEGKVKRGAMPIIQANRTMLEWTVPRPAQAHELSGSVTIRVESPLFGAPGSSIQAKVLSVATRDAEVLCSQQGPITHIPSTEIDENGDASMSAVMALDVTSTEFDPLTAPTIIESGRLVAAPILTAEERRSAERDAWLADKAIHRDEP